MAKNLFNEEEFNAQKEWRGMPEFTQDKQEPYAVIIFRFATREDLQRFAKLVKQNLTSKTKSAWYPERSHWGGEAGKRKYVDEK